MLFEEKKVNNRVMMLYDGCIYSTVIEDFKPQKNSMLVHKIGEK